MHPQKLNPRCPVLVLVRGQERSWILPQSCLIEICATVTQLNANSGVLKNFRAAPPKKISQHPTSGLRHKKKAWNYWAFVVTGFFSDVFFKQQIIATVCAREQIIVFIRCGVCGAKTVVLNAHCQTCTGASPPLLFSPFTHSYRPTDSLAQQACRKPFLWILYSSTTSFHLFKVNKNRSLHTANKTSISPNQPGYEYIPDCTVFQNVCSVPINWHHKTRACPPAWL